MSTETPRHAVSSLDHFVTQWMSVRISSLGKARSSSHDHEVGSSTAPVSENVHVSRDPEGVGPADNTGKSSVTYWPGGIRLASTSRRRRPPNPREISGLMSSHLADDVRAVDLHEIAVRVTNREERVESSALDR